MITRIRIVAIYLVISVTGCNYGDKLKSLNSNNNCELILKSTSVYQNLYVQRGTIDTTHIDYQFSTNIPIDTPIKIVFRDTIKLNFIKKISIKDNSDKEFIIRLYIPEARGASLGYIKKHGNIWFDVHHMSIEQGTFNCKVIPSKENQKLFFLDGTQVLESDTAKFYGRKLKALKLPKNYKSPPIWRKHDR